MNVVKCGKWMFKSDTKCGKKIKRPVEGQWLLLLTIDEFYFMQLWIYVDVARTMCKILSDDKYLYRTMNFTKSYLSKTV